MTLDPVHSARSAGLRHIADHRSGIRRKMGPHGFEYYRPRGGRIRHAAELKRIAALAIPPAWTDVWICPDPRGHIQATGRDARGRKQYRYHPDWRATRDETKYERMLDFAAALPALRTRTSADLAKPGLVRDKVLATVVRLLEKSMIRVGNEEYARTNGSFGLTTMKDRHVKVLGGTLTFQFKGKSGIKHSVTVDDPRLARIVKHCRDLPGQELFQYVDDDGRRRKVDSGDVNAYLKAITGREFTAKDFRTWSGTVLACAALRELCSAQAAVPRSEKGRAAAGVSAASRNRTVLQAIDAVAGLLGNTRAVCRKSYIHPTVIDAYMDGWLQDICGKYWSPAHRSRRGGLSADEAAVVALLKRAAQETKKKAA